MDIKVQVVFGKEAATDQRVNPIGIDQGDHHRTIREWRVDGNEEVILQGLAVANEKAVEAGRMLFATLRENGALDEFLTGASAFMGENVTDAEFACVLVRGYPND